MRGLNIPIYEIEPITLAADARMGPTSYSDDHIWELTSKGGNTTALSFQTTYGLRAQAMRIFPRFREGDLAIQSTSDFIKPPVVTCLYPNFAQLEFSPFEGIDAQSEYWVPESQANAGRFTFYNRSESKRVIQFELACQLTPYQGERMAFQEIKAATVLLGRTSSLHPVVFLTGSPQAGVGPFPSLMHIIKLDPMEMRQVIWSQAALADITQSFEKARSLAARPWEAEKAYIENLNAGNLEIITGDQDWNRVFHLSTIKAFQLLVGPSPALPNISFVNSRQPDHGHSVRGDGSDYNHLWNGQSPLETYYLCRFLIPSFPRIAKGLLANFIHIQEDDGYIDWKPGLGGQRSRLLATPLLASIAWSISNFEPDLQFLRDVYKPLRKFLDKWFSSEQDRDGDSVPEWDHVMQAGAEDHPVFSETLPGALGADITKAETAGLCAMLFRECTTLIQIARLLGENTDIEYLEEKCRRLKIALETAWEPAQSCYLNWDRDSHQSPPGKLLGRRTGPGILFIHKQMSIPTRLLIRISPATSPVSSLAIFIHGAGQTGSHRVEQLKLDRINWQGDTTNLTSEQLYTSVNQVTVQGINATDLIEVFVIDFQYFDLSNFLPLWAGLAPPETAKIAIERTLLNPKVCLTRFGLAPPLYHGYGSQTATRQAVHIPWNDLICEGLVSYGYRKQAAKILANIMRAVIASIKRDGVFRRAYDIHTGEGMEESNTLHGLAPIPLFLEILGVRIIDPKKIILLDFNPFPWPVTLKYQGTTVFSLSDRITVIFPNGQTINILDSLPCQVSLENAAHSFPQDKIRRNDQSESLPKKAVQTNLRKSIRYRRN